MSVHVLKSRCEGKMLATGVITVTAAGIGSRNLLKKPSQLPKVAKEKRERLRSRVKDNHLVAPLSALERRSLQTDRRSAVTLVGATLSCFLLHPRGVLADVEDLGADASEQTSTPDRKLQLYVGIQKDFKRQKKKKNEL